MPCGCVCFCMTKMTRQHCNCGHCAAWPPRAQRVVKTHVPHHLNFSLHLNFVQAFHVLLHHRRARIDVRPSQLLKTLSRNKPTATPSSLTGSCGRALVDLSFRISKSQASHDHSHKVSASVWATSTILAGVFPVHAETVPCTQRPCRTRIVSQSQAITRPVGK